MKLLKLLVLLFFVWLLADYQVLLAEDASNLPLTGIITGKIIDESTGLPMEYVNVALFKLPDSAMVTGAITNGQGQFILDKVAAGDYYLVVTFMGYKKLKTPKITVDARNKRLDLKEMKLSPISQQLQSVEIKAEKSRIEYKIDKRVINVDKDISSRGGTAVNVLENTPSVQVDPQGNLTLRGSSDYLVLIDGKPSVLKGSDALKQIPSGAIKQIEVITNPSARYDVEGQAGIINVIMKKDKLQGLNGMINFSGGTGGKYTANTLVNYRKNKLNYFGGVDYARNKYINNITITDNFFLPTLSEHLINQVRQIYHNDNLTFKGGMDVDMNETNTFSLSGSYGEEGYDQGNDANYFSWNDTSLADKFNSSHQYADIMGRVTNLTADYKHTFAENHTLSFSNQYFSWDGKDDNKLSEVNTDPDFHAIDTKSALRFIKDNNNYQYRFNVDYTRPVKTAKLEAGFQYRYEYRHEDLVFKNFDVIYDSWIVNPAFSNRLHY
ncbi:MAG: TonB-dependent receptor, partial [Bacteroidetes bacterium]|nr:TonB-dependent receptor [Bacteroidota bacterium]